MTHSRFTVAVAGGKENLNEIYHAENVGATVVRNAFSGVPVEIVFSPEQLKGFVEKTLQAYLA